MVCSQRLGHLQSDEKSIPVGVSQEPWVVNSDPPSS
jgi:hypothetical protein